MGKTLTDGGRGENEERGGWGLEEVAAELSRKRPLVAETLPRALLGDPKNALASGKDYLQKNVLTTGKDIEAD